MNQSTTSENGTKESRLHLWPKGTDVAKVREIVESLDLGYVVKPFWYTSDSEEVERVLVLANGFPYSPTVDYIYPKGEAQFQEAIEWALGLRQESRGARLWEDAMKRIFGEDLVWSEVAMPEGWSDV